MRIHVSKNMFPQNIHGYMDTVRLGFSFQLCLVRTLFRVFPVQKFMFWLLLPPIQLENPQFLLKVSGGFMLTERLKRGLGEQLPSRSAATLPLPLL